MTKPKETPKIAQLRDAIAKLEANGYEVRPAPRNPKRYFIRNPQGKPLSLASQSIVSVIVTAGMLEVL